MAQKHGLQYITVPVFVAYLSSAHKYRLIIIACVCINYNTTFNSIRVQNRFRKSRIDCSIIIMFLSHCDHFFENKTTGTYI